MSYTYTLGRGPRMVLIAALLVALWFTWPTPISPDLAVVAHEHIAAAWPYVEWGPAVRQTGHFGSYKLTFQGQREDQDITMLVSIAASAEGTHVISAEMFIGSTSELPMNLARIAMITGVAILLFFRLIPQVFGRKCPRDQSLLQLAETLVVPHQYSPDLITLPGIVQRTWACSKCDFKHAEAAPDPRHRPMKWDDPSLHILSPGMISAALSDAAFESGRQAAAARAVTDDQYAAKLAEARRKAAEASSPDSPWLRR